MNNIRVRFAPSPTGTLHIGGLRTALYNYLLAKKSKGSFILRLDDTDKTRLIQESENYIFESLRWCGIHPDEYPLHGVNSGPYRQSERISIYIKYIQELIIKGNSYYAFDTNQELEHVRKKYQKRGKLFTYNPVLRNKMKNSLSISKEELNNRLKSGLPYVIRFKNPINQLIKIEDQIRWSIYFTSNILDDKVLIKSDGTPTYHLTNVIDDHLMKMTHVLRGEEWISSTPLHLLLYYYFNWNPPKFSHLPLILNPEGKGKISKRNISKLEFTIFTLQWINTKTKELIPGYREIGYFPESLINMIAFLGWNPGSKEEIFSLQTLIKNFSIEKLSKSAARFYKEKIRWLNQQYLNKKPIKEILKFFHLEAESKGIHLKDTSFIKKVVELPIKRAYLIKDICKTYEYFFRKPYVYEEKSMKKLKKLNTIYYLKRYKNLLLSLCYKFPSCIFKPNLFSFIKKEKLDPKIILFTLRLALVGDLSGEDLFFIIKMIGRLETLNRIDFLYKLITYTKELLI